MNYGQSKSTVSLTAAEAEAACHSLDSRQANQQDIQYAQAQGSDCCQCGWSTDGATYPTDNPRQGCGATNKCSWSNMWNAWCVADTGKSPLTIAEVILQTASLTPLIARFMGPTWGPSGADKTQVGPMLAPWTLLSGTLGPRQDVHHFADDILRCIFANATFCILIDISLKFVSKGPIDNILAMV